MPNTISKQTDPKLTSVGKVERMKNTFVPKLEPYQYEKNILLEKQGFVTVFPGATVDPGYDIRAVNATKKMPNVITNSQGVLLRKD